MGNAQIISKLVPDFQFDDVRPRKRVEYLRATLQAQRGATTGRSGANPIALKDHLGFFDGMPHNTVRGHLVALKFGAPDSDDNLVPMYGQFNNGGAWSQAEAKIAEIAYNSGTTGPIDLRIKVYYERGDPRIPSAFNFRVEWPHGDGTNHYFESGKFDHPAPQPAYYGRVQDAILLEELYEAEIAMKSACWFVEKHVKPPFHFDTTLVVPGILARRPYAVLDYMTLVLNKYPQFCITPGNNQDFTDAQKEFIFWANVARNKGYIVSDDWENDYVYDGCALDEELFQNYRTDALNITRMQGVLVHTGGHQKPEVDHIIPKSNLGGLISGSNAYSNAQVISHWLNNRKRGKVYDD